MKAFLLVLKGMAMGAANVIPGVSGGTIAFIVGVFERLISALKGIDLIAIKLLFTGKWKAFADRTDLRFLFFLFLGVGISIISLAKVMEWAFQHHESLTLAFFFGLILASIIGVGRQVSDRSMGVLIFFVLGLGIATSIAFLPPAVPNDAPWYIVICGMVAVSSMILPGLSGSYILLLMGNYVLVMSAIVDIDLSILLPMTFGVLVGLVLFSRLLAWLFAYYKDFTVAMLTGFVAGSMLIIWPWKETIFSTLLGKEKAVGYRWLLPPLDSDFIIAVVLAIIGFFMVWLLDRGSKAAVKN